MKRIFSIAICFALTTGYVVSQGNVDFAGGDGSSSDPYQVEIAEHLDNVRDVLDPNEVIYFVQTDDIDLSTYSNWEPIGGAGNGYKFNGRYDGQGFTISNLTIDRPNTDNIGLFGHFGQMDAHFGQTIRIKNIVLKDVDIKGARGVGALIGRVTASDRARVIECRVIGGTVTGDAATGGLIGSHNSFEDDMTVVEDYLPAIRECYAAVNVAFSGSGSNNEKFGGLVGCNQSGAIENSYATGDVTVDAGSGTVENVGGLAGCSYYKGVIENSYSTGEINITGTVNNVGGLNGNIGDGSDEGTVTSSYWDTETSGISTSNGGDGKTTAEMQTQNTFSGWDFSSIWDIIENETYPYIQAFDLSGFDITDPGNQTAGENFNIDINNATDVAGFLLDGDYRVTITSDIAEEGDEGEVFDNENVTFNEGEATIVDLEMIIAGEHDLTFDVGRVTDDKIQAVEIEPAAAVKLFIEQQPAENIEGNSDDEPASLGNIVINSADEYDNISGVGLDSEQLVSVAIEVDGTHDSGTAELGGDSPVDIQSGTATFENLSIDKEGEGFVLRFMSSSPEGLGHVDTDAFNVDYIYDRSGFIVSSDSPVIVDEPFEIDIKDAKDARGDHLDGDINIVVSSDMEGTIFNSNVAFSGGKAAFNISLEVEGTHELTVDVYPVSDDETLNVSVETDQSGFSIKDPGQQYQDFLFDLEIIDAKCTFGDELDGDHALTITSSQDGEVYNDDATFSLGEASINISLNNLGDHDLTVNIDCVTDDETITGVNVAENESGFELSGPVITQIAGIDTVLTITDARTADAGELDGTYNVNVTSNISEEGSEGEVFNAGVSFTNGEASVLINLEEAGNHTLTVAIESITPTETVGVDVDAAAASKLVITQQPTDGDGGNEGDPVNIGTVILETQDVYGNPSTDGLDDPQDVSVGIENDASDSNDATLSGTTPLDIQTGTATFDDLTIDKEGNGYTIKFTSTGLDEDISDPFDITGIDDETGFDIVDPGPQMTNQAFEIALINAKDKNGVLLNGVHIVNVQVGLSDDDFNVTFENGFGKFTYPDNIGVTDTYEFTMSVEDITDSEKINIQFVSEDYSGFDFAPDLVENPTAGTAFNIKISNAKDKADGDLDGRKHYVTLTTDNTDEGDDGILFSDSLYFTGGTETGGNATIENIELFIAGSQELEAEIDWVTDSETEAITVDPNIPDTLDITQQPASVSGNYNDEPVNVGLVSLQMLDEHGNETNEGLGGDETVSVSIENNPGGATLTDGEGSSPADVDIRSGAATFDNLYLDKDGTGYTLRFTYNGTPSLDCVDSDPFDITNVEDLSGFDVQADTDPAYQNIEFNLSITNAQDETGTELSGDINVTVTSDQSEDDVVYNTDVNFTNGEADIPITLTKIATHNLTVDITGITEDEVLENFEVAADQSGFDLALDPVGDQYENVPFDIDISNAKDLGETDLDGDINVTVTSDQSGDDQVFNGEVNFTNGNATVNISLTTTVDHTLTVNVDGITDDETINANVLSDPSGFDVALADTEDKTAGDDFDINITNAFDIDGNDVDGNNHVIIDSDLSGEVFNNTNVDFTTGSATITMNLESADNHTLTVSIENITDSENVGVNVLPAAVNYMLITTEPTGGSGNNDDSPAGIGNVVIQAYDVYDNESDVDLSGTTTVTATIENDASDAGVTASLDGTLDRDISSGTATFNDLTLDQDGNGYTLKFTYNGSPTLAAVTSSAFDMTNVNAYEISLKDSEENILDDESPFVFDTKTEGYDPITAENITISREAAGIIENLNVSKSGPNDVSFTITQPTETTLHESTESTTFTIKPNDALVPGSYTATIEVTADNDVSEEFDVEFEVLEDYSISLKDDEDNPLDADNELVFETVTEGYDPISDETITITNTGGLEITDLEVNLTGDNTDDFTVGDPDPANIYTEEISTFTIRPDDDLAVGNYSATVTVTNAAENVSESFDVSFEVIAYTYEISLDPEGPIDFGNKAEGYPEVSAIEVTINNTGTGEITNLGVDFSGNDPGSFEVVIHPDVTLASELSTNFSVRPIDGLSVGSYSANVDVTADDGINEQINVSFTVVNEFRWVGNSSDWNDSDNWDIGAVPEDNSEVIIPATTNDPIISSQNITANNLIIEAGVTLTISSLRRLTVDNGGELTLNDGAILNVNSGSTLRINGTVNLEAGTELTGNGSIVNNTGAEGLILKSDAGGTASLIHNSTGIEATVERHVAGDQTFHLISPPVSGQSISDFLSENSDVIAYNASADIYAMRHYIEETGSWSDFYSPNQAGNLDQGKVYTVGLEQAGTLTHKGTLLHTDLSVNFTEEGSRWNGTGNPFASSLNVNDGAGSFLDKYSDQLDPEFSGLWIWDPGDGEYKIINGVPDLSQSYLAPGQGFIVRVKEGGGSVGFETGMREHESQEFHKKEQDATDWHNIIVQAEKDAGQSVTTSFAFNKDMTTGLDVGYDAGLYTENHDFKLYSRMISGEKNDLNLAIQALPDQWKDNMVIPIGFEYSDGGEVTFSARSMSLPGYVTPVLEDRELDKFVDLANENHTVDISGGSEPLGRFYLHIKADIHKLNLAVYPEDAGTVEGEGEYEEGGAVTVTATPNEGWEFASWTDEGDSQLSESESYTFDMPNEDITLTANFKEKPDKYDLILTAEPEEGGSVDGEGEYIEGEYATVTATPNDGWEFVNWTYNDSEISDQAEFDYTMPGENVTLSANFKEDDVSIEVPEDSEISIFPNPARNKITVEADEKIKQIRLFDISGQVIKNISVDDLQTEINVNNIRPGIYIIEIQTTKGMVTQQIQISR